jgi:hypothetical protein
MSQYIDGTQNGTGIFSTKVPGYDETADIQAALKVFLYGSKDFDPTAENAVTAIKTAGSSLAKHLQVMKDEIALLQDLGFASVQSIEPTNPINGFIWVDSDQSQTNTPLVQGVILQNTQPSTDLVDGLLWVDKNSSPLAMYVYDATAASWRQIGV